MLRSLHRKNIAILRAAAFAGVCILGATSLNAVAQTTLEGSKPRLLAHAVRLGAAPESQEVTISVYLKFRNTADLDKLIDDQQNPDSPRYQKFLTPAEFHAQYSPLPADAAKVKAELARMGFTIVDAPAGGLYVTVRGTIAQVKGGLSCHSGSLQRRWQDRALSRRSPICAGEHRAAGPAYRRLA